MSESELYKWAENPSKLKRAQDEVTASGKKFKDGKEEEEAVKIVYRRLLGRVVGEPARGSVEDKAGDISKQLEAAREEGREEGRKEYADASADTEASKKERKE